MMRTRAKMKIVASDRARRENVPRHILFYFTGNSPHLKQRDMQTMNFYIKEKTMARD